MLRRGYADDPSHAECGKAYGDDSRVMCVLEESLDLASTLFTDHQRWLLWTSRFPSDSGSTTRTPETAYEL